MTSGMLALTVFCCVSGGPYGLEPLISAAGPAMGLLLILAVPLLWALPDALTTAELATAIPEQGGYVIWVRRAMGPFWGFLNAWWSWIYALIDAALYPVMFTEYLSKLLDLTLGIRVLEGNPWLRWSVAALVVVAFTLLNIRGTKLVGKTSSLFAYAIVLPFLLLTAIALYRIFAEGRSLFPSFAHFDTRSASATFSAGLATVMWNYLGWDALSTIAEEVEDPSKAYPRAILYGIPFVTLVYFLPTLAGLAFYPDASKWTENAWPDIARAVGGEWLGYLVNVAGLVSPVALFTASLLGSSRLPFVLAEERFLPRALMEIHPRFGTPWKALILCGAIYGVLVFQTFQDLVKVNVIMYSVALFLECASLVILRWKEPNLPRPFRVKGGWPVLALVFALPVAMVSLLVFSDLSDPESRQTLWPTVVAIASGPLVWLGCRTWGRKRAG